MILGKAFFHYKKNFKAALAFALLLVFVPAFSFLEGVSSSSGTMFLDYVSFASFALLPAAFIAQLILLLFYSFFISVIVFSVRKDLSKLKLNFYLREMIRKFTVKIFAFFAVFSIFVYVLAMVLVWLGVNMVAVSVLIFVLSLFVLFVPQSIVVDEEDLRHALSNNFDFIAKNPGALLKVVVTGSVLLAVSVVIGQVVDYFVLAGAQISLLLTLVFVLPFVETMKTYLYMLKFDLVKLTQSINPGHVEHEPGVDLVDASKKY